MNNQSAFNVLSQILSVGTAKILTAFSERDQYIVHKKKKRNGGYRIIHEPPRTLKMVQRAILQKILYPISKKGMIDSQMHGFLPWHSTAGNSVAHTNRPWNFSYTMDLKDAFPSVHAVHIAPALRTLALDIVEKSVKYRLDPDSDIRNKRRNNRHNPPRSKSYQQYVLSFEIPFFRNSRLTWFREMLLDETEREQALLLLIDAFTLAIDLCTLPDGTLPQGAPPSGFILTMVLTHEKVLDIIRGYFANRNWEALVSMYADDIFISSMKKLSAAHIAEIVDLVQRVKIWTIHPEKHKTFVRKSIGPLVCGIRISRIHCKTFEEFNRYVSINNSQQHEKFKKHFLSGKTWTIDQITVPKKLRKKVRALQYQHAQNPSDETLKHKLSGYLGYILHISRMQKAFARSFI